MNNIRPTHRHLAEYIPVLAYEDEDYFRRYLNDIGETVISVNSLVEVSAVGSGDSETYFRRYLNDIS